MIRLICGLQEPDSGSYRIYGIKNTDPQIVRSRRRMGAVVETPSIYLDMNARDNIRQQYQILGIPSENEIDELLQLVGLSDTGNKKSKEFFTWYASETRYCDCPCWKSGFFGIG